MRDRDTAPPAPGFWTLASVEGWERFAIQGTKSLLTLFLLTDLLVRPGTLVAGLAALRGIIEGDGDDHRHGLRLATLRALWCADLSHPAAGRLDRGSQRAATAGHVCRGRADGGGHDGAGQPAGALAGLALMIGGIGLLKGNLAAEVGALRGHSGGERLFAGYLAFLNSGAMLGPLIGGWLAARTGFGIAFAAMAGSMIVAFLLLRTAPASRWRSQRRALSRVSIGRG